MLVIRDLELSRTYIGGDYRNWKFQTTAKVQIGGYYSDATVKLTDEQTARAVDFIVGMIREGLTVEISKPEPVVEAAEEPEALLAKAGEDDLAPL